MDAKATILVVDDDASVRGLIVCALGMLGYRTLVAADGLEAVDLASAHAGAVDLLLTDVGLPGLEGPQVFERLRVARPGLRVLFTSGLGAGVAQGPGVAFLGKPFTPSTLSAKVRQVLDSPPRPRGPAL